MFAQRQIFRSAPRLAAQLRANGQRRLMSSHPNPSSVESSTENAFVRERRAVKEHAAATTDLWLKISIYVCIPALALAAANAYILYKKHWEHWSHMPPLEERVQYPYQNIRTKNFPWGDGDKTLFWNPAVNYNKKD